MKKFFIYGGCISRDVFNKEFNLEGELAVVEYVARYSVAKLCFPSASITVCKDLLPSDFQRKTIKRDIDNSLLELINKTDFDFFLMDVMSIRQRLVFFDKTLLTYSEYLKKANILDGINKFVWIEDVEYWEYFESGIKKLFEYLRCNNEIDKVLINKIYYSSFDSDGVFFDNQSSIKKQNKTLDKAYSIISKYIGDDQFIVYPEHLFVADPNHHWGRSPLHYIKDFYNESFNRLKQYDAKL